MSCIGFHNKKTKQLARDISFSQMRLSVLEKRLIDTPKEIKYLKNKIMDLRREIHNILNQNTKKKDKYIRCATKLA